MATWSAGLEVLIRDRSLVHIGLFLTALIDATGLPFPGRALLVAAGATMATGWSDVFTMTLAAALGHHAKRPECRHRARLALE